MPATLDALRAGIEGGLGVSFQGMDLGRMFAVVLAELSAVRHDAQCADEAWQERFAEARSDLEAAKQQLFEATNTRFEALRRELHADLRSVEERVTERIDRVQPAVAQLVRDEVAGVSARVAADLAAVRAEAAEQARAQADGFAGELAAHAERHEEAARGAAEQLGRFQTLTQERLALQREEAEEAARRTEEKLDRMGRRQKEVVSMNLFKALRANVRALYFAKLVSFVEHRRAERKKQNCCVRLLFKQKNFMLKICYDNLFRHMKIKKRHSARIRHLRAVCGNTDKGIIKNRFDTWQGFVHLRRAYHRQERERQSQCIQALMGMVRTGQLRYGYLQLARHRKHRREQALRLEMARALRVNANQQRKQWVWDLWVQHRRQHLRREQGREQAGVFQAAIARHVYTVYFAKLAEWRRVREQKRAVYAQLALIQQQGVEGRKAHWFAHWRRAAEAEIEGRRQQAERESKRRVALQFCRTIPNNLRLDYFRKWARAVEERRETARRQREERRAEAARRAEDMSLRKRADRELARRSYAAWAAFLAARVRLRAEQVSRENIGGVAARTEALWAQLELHQRTVSNTNSCVQRLVDKLMQVDESIDTLDKDKASRRELQTLVELYQGTAAADTDPPYLADHPPATPPPRGSGGGGGGGGGASSLPHHISSIGHLPDHTTTGDDRSGGGAAAAAAGAAEAARVLLQKTSGLPPPPPHPRVDDLELMYARETVSRVAAAVGGGGGGGGGAGGHQRGDYLLQDLDARHRRTGGGGVPSHALRSS